MADRYAVAAGGNWNSTSTWSDVSGGAGGFSVPGTGDNVKLDAASGNVAITAIAACRSLDCTGYTGTLTQSSVTLGIGDGTSGAGNIALKFSAGMTFSPHSSSNISYISSSGVTQTIDTAGKTMANSTFTTAGSSFQYLSSLYAPNNSLTLTRGTIDTNNQNVTLRTFTNNSGIARSLILGTSNLTITGIGINAGLLFASTGLTLSAASSTITMSGTNAEFQGGGCTYGTVVFSGTNTTSHTITGANTFGALTVTGFAVKIASITLAANQTVTGTFTVNGNSAINRVLVRSDVIGTARTITAATVTTSNTDWRDITGAGAASWDLSAITGNSGDCGGNTGITFTAATTQTATGTASFTWSTHGWTSRVPLPQDTAVVSNAFVAGRTVTVDMPRVGTIDFTGSTGSNLNLYFNVGSPGVECYGDITLRAGMGVVNLGVSYHTFMLSAAQQNLTMAGNSNVSNYNIYVDRSKLQLQDAYTATSATNGIISRFSGHIDTQSFDVQCALIWCINTSNTNLLGTSTFSITYVGAASVIDFVGATSARMSAASATFIVNGASTNTRTVALGACSIGTLTYTVANSPGILTVTGGGTIGTLNLGSGRTFRQTAGTTLTIGTTINATGVVWPYVYLAGGSGATISTPDSVPLSITGDIDLRFYGAADDWSPGSVSAAYIEKGSSYILYSGTAGKIVFVGGGKTFTSTANVPFADGADGWVRCTVDVNDGAGNSVAKFWTSTDGSTWTQLGSTVTSAGTITLTDNTSLLTFGQQGTATGFKGKLYRVQIRNNILDDGTGIVFDADFTAKQWGVDSFIESSSNAATVTLGSGFTDGAIRIQATTAGVPATITKTSGTVEVQYCSIKDSTATGGATFHAIDSVNVSGNTGWNFITSWVPKVIYVWF